MKKEIMIGAFALAMLSGTTFAAELNAYFDTTTGKLVIPNLELNGEVFYATLTLTNSATLTFQADATSLSNITPPKTPVAGVNTGVTAIHGTWKVPGKTTSVTFNANGTYSQFEEFPVTDKECQTGSETGTYKWEPSTGLMLIRTQTDTNGPCGLSNPRDNVPYRFFVNGTGMQIIEKGANFSPLTFSLTKVSQ